VSAAQQRQEDAPIAATHLEDAAALPRALMRIERDVVEAHVLRHVDVVETGDAVVGAK
jgi:hypothetical protein